jgi:hypothetical protein
MQTKQEQFYLQWKPMMMLQVQLPIMLTDYFKKMNKNEQTNNFLLLFTLGNGAMVQSIFRNKWMQHK